MKSSLSTLLLFLFSTIIVQAQNQNQAQSNTVTLETYYNHELYSYTCSPQCKEEYEKYQPCFNLLDNEHINDTFSTLCEAYKKTECQAFINDIYKIDGVCTNGSGPEDYDVHDEINMNRVYYLAMCTRDKDNNLCTYSKNIQDEVYKPVNLYHMKEDVNNISNVCNKGICRETLKQILELLIPLYENDVKTDPEYNYEKEYIENDKKAIGFLQSTECYSQDPFNLNDLNKPNDEGSDANNLKTYSFLSLLFISFITFILI